MKKLLKESTFCDIFNFLAIVLFATLFYYSLSVTGLDEDPAIMEKINLYQASPHYNLLKIAIAILVLYWVGKFSKYLENRKIRNVILAVVCILTGIISVYWVHGCKAVPQADQMLICQFANAFNQGDFRGFNQGIYVARYPQQLGMITLLRVLFTIFGESNYQSFQYLSALMVPLMVLAGCKIVRILSDDNVRVELYYLLFMGLCFPMYTYPAFVYGDYISVVFAMLGVWMYLACTKKFYIYKAVFLGIFMGIAVLLRMNLIILVIALGIVMLVKLLFHRNLSNLVLLLALIIGVSFFHAGLLGIYHDVRQEDAPAIPALLFVVMGLNDDYQRPGWHNNYEYLTFAECDDNVEAATEEALADLQSYFDLYRSNPQYMLDFFTRKMNAQWNSPMYQAITMNSKIEGEQALLVEIIYNRGRVTSVIESGMKIFQMLMYGSILFLLIVQKKRIKNIETYVFLIAVFGGFIFSMIWEAKVRYILPYLFMQIPYMAMGINALIGYWENKRAQGIVNAVVEDEK